MELPRYRFPKLSNILTYVWNRGKHFLEKAGTIIFAASIVIWVLTYFPGRGDIDNSFVSMLGKVLQPLFAPLGFSWQIVSALIFGGVAKEVIVSSLSQFYGNVSNIHFDPLIGATLMTFILGYMPCFATLAAIKSETSSSKYTLFAIFYSLAISYLLSLVVYTMGRWIL
jgi:ferrous iron transport protein B